MSAIPKTGRYLLKRMGSLGAALFLAGCTRILCNCSTTADAPPVPVIYCTDLFHPHVDPDDHFDIATLYAIPEIDIKAIILDQGENQRQKPGAIPVSQLNYLTGRNVPHYIGLAQKLKIPADKALHQPSQYQEGVQHILDILTRSPLPVTMITVGSLRDVAAAFNRAPGLFRRKVDRLLIFIGEAGHPDFIEYNVGLDPAAYRRIMQSGLPVYWVPCFDGGPWQNRGSASFWRASHAELLENVSPRLMNFFIYALLRRTDKDHLAFLDRPVDPAARRKVLAGRRNLWCTAVFTCIARRPLVIRNNKFISVPEPTREKFEQEINLFSFEEVRLSVNERGIVTYGPDQPYKVKRFKILDKTNYAGPMTSVTANLLSSLQKK